MEIDFQTQTLFLKSDASTLTLSSAENIYVTLIDGIKFICLFVNASVIYKNHFSPSLVHHHKNRLRRPAF